MQELGFNCCKEASLIFPSEFNEFKLSFLLYLAVEVEFDGGFLLEDAY